MRAWQIHAFGDMRLEEVPDPVPDAGDVLVQIRVAQPSVTEVIRFNGNAARRSGEFRKLIEQGPTQLFGHEAAGEVVEVGANVQTLRPGDRVAVFSSRTSCGTCRFCKESLPEGCLAPRRIGQEIAGCFAEYAALPETCLVKLTDDVTFSDGAVVQSATSAFKSTLAAGIQPGDIVVVLGQGAMGLATTQLAKAFGARTVIATARRPSSIATARELGADVVINPQEVDAVEAVRELTGGVGAHVAFETAGGSPAEGLAGYTTFLQAAEMLRPGGKLVVASSLVEPVTLPGLQFLQGPGISVVFDAGFQRDMRGTLVDLIASRRLRFGPMVTHSLEGIEAVPEAFEITGNKRAHDAINPAQVVIS